MSFRCRGVAQFGSAPGLGPGGRGFKSLRPDHLRPVGQAVKTPAFHAGYKGSNPLRVTILISVWAISSVGRAPALQAGCRRFKSVIAHHINFLELWCSGLTYRPVTPGIAGSTPVSSAIFKSRRSSTVEQLTCNQQVAGSNPIVGSILIIQSLLGQDFWRVKQTKR